MTAIRVLRVNPASGRQLRAFVRVAYPIYRTYPLWVPPLEREIAAAVQPAGVPDDCDGAAFLALAGDGRVVGRIAAFVHGPWNARTGDRRGLFNLFECIDDPETARALFEAAGDWAREHGMASLEGPRGLHMSEGFGLLTSGFEHAPSFSIPYNPPYYERLLRAAGLHPKARWQSGYLDRTSRVEPRLHAVAERARARSGYEIVPLRSRAELRRWLPRWLDLYNSVIDDPAEWPPMLPDEAEAVARRFIWFADPSLLKIVAWRGEPVGFLLAFPDIAAGLRAARGHLLPSGWAHLLRSRLTTRTVVMNALGLTPEHRGTGAVAVIASDITRSLLASRHQVAEVALIGSENTRILRVLRRIGIRWAKAHTTYSKQL